MKVPLLFLQLASVGVGVVDAPGGTELAVESFVQYDAVALTTSFARDRDPLFLAQIGHSVNLATDLVVGLDAQVRFAPWDDYGPEPQMQLRIIAQPFDDPRWAYIGLAAWDGDGWTIVFKLDRIVYPW